MTDRPGPAEAAVRAELDRISASPPLAGATRQARLLRYVVERTLDGRGDEIKEYVLGVEVFDRGPDFDPRIDTIVRVEARRLRARLDEYYAGPGARDAVGIRLRPGSYVPQFEDRAAMAGDRRQDDDGSVARASEPAPPAATARNRRLWWAGAGAMMVGGLAVVLAWQPVATPPAAGRVAVLPATHYPADAEAEALAERVTDGITTELARLGGVEVVSRTSTRRFAGTRESAPAIAAALSARWLLEATVHREASGVRVEARLVDPEGDRKVWVESFESGHEALRDLDRRVAAAVDAALRRVAGPR